MPRRPGLTFRTWLWAQRRREDPIGDLARDVRLDRQLRGRPLTPRRLAQRLQEAGACEGAEVALERATQEYREAVAAALEAASTV